MLWNLQDQRRKGQGWILKCVILYKIVSCHLNPFFFSSFLMFSLFLLLKLSIFYFFSANEEDEIILNVECHYSQAKVGGRMFSIGDCAFIKVALPFIWTIQYMLLTYNW